MMKKLRHSSLMANTAYLYLLAFSNQLLNLMTIPYLTRTLGPEAYGVVGFALSLMSYVQMIADFGFLYSGTESVSRHADDGEYLSELFSLITAYKCFCGTLMLLVMLILCNAVPALKVGADIIPLYTVAYCLNALLPDYIYRGLEQMRHITIRTVLVRLFFTVLVFVFVRSRADYVLLPLLLTAGNAVAVAYSWFHIRKEFGIRFCRFRWLSLRAEVRKSFPFFFSRIASTVYQAANTTILGLLYGGQNVVGYYSSADKLLSLVKSVSSPVADSLYPYMLKRKDFRLVRVLLFAYACAALCVAVPVFLFSERIAVLLFGADYAPAGTLIRCLMPAILVIFPTYVICFPVLVPLGLSKYANLSNVFGAAVQLVFLLALAFSHRIDVYTICISSSVTECLVFLFRLSAWLICSRRNRQQ